MPAQYLAMKEKFMSQGMSEDTAQSKAARIYNAKHPGAPVGPNYEKKRGKKKMMRGTVVAPRQNRKGYAV